MPANFPSRAPIGLITGSLSAILCLLPILAAWQLLQTPIRKFYFGQYALSWLSQTPVGTVAAFFRHAHGHTYRVLLQNSHLLYGAWDTQRAISVGKVYFESAVPFHTWLCNRFYGGRELPDLLRVPLIVWACSAASLFTLGIVLDFKRRKRAREGQQLRGGELLTVDEFNRTTKGDGFALYVQK